MSFQNNIVIRDATEDDMVDVRDILNDVIRNTLFVYQEQEVTTESRIAVLRDRRTNGFPFFVAEIDNEVVGYATYGPFRAFFGYRYTVEHSVYIRSDQRGKGIGKLLLEKLIEVGTSTKLHLMVACIDSNNLNSIELHKKYGFVETGRMSEAGRKNNQWLTLVIMQRVLSEQVD